MARLPSIFSALLVTWLILFDQQIVTKIGSFYVDDYPDYEEPLITTEGVPLTESPTHINDINTSTMVTETEASTHTEDTTEFESSSDDIIDLNIGGQYIKTYRSTLTAVPSSKLALMFSKDNKKKFAIQPGEAYFFDYNPAQFEYLLDQLRTIKRTPRRPSYELDFKAPNADVLFDFSDMLLDLGLIANHYLSPLAGTHLGLTVNSLVGWKECYRGKYNTPFDLAVLTNICKGERLLVACRPTANKDTLTVAGIGKREDLFHPCSQNSYCSTTMKNGTGFYYVESQAWGFQGRPKDVATANSLHNPHYSFGTQQGNLLLNPCDSSDEYSQYRLCWSLRSNVGRGGGDRCGSLKNLHNTNEWERLIYQPA